MESLTAKVIAYIQDHPFLEESLRQGLINQSALANLIKSEIDVDNNSKISSIIASIRRYQAKIKEKSFLDTKYGNGAQSTLKTDVAMLTYRKSQTLLYGMAELSKLLSDDFHKFFHFVYGQDSCAIIVDQTQVEFVENRFLSETLVRKNIELASISLRYSENLANIPGNLFKLTRALAWKNVSIYNLIETVGESIFIIKQDQATQALQSLGSVLKKNI